MSANLDYDLGFEATYTCFPLINTDKLKVERGGKILLPASALEGIDRLNLPYPLMFKVTNCNNNHYTHAGVFEFTAEEGQINVPKWLLTHLNLKSGGRVTVESVSLPSATYCKLEPLTRNFAYISDTESVLEENLRYFACITEGDVLFIHEPNKNQVYKVRISETKPKSAVCILDCEMELELAMPERAKRSVRNRNSESTSNKSPSKKNTFKKFVAFEGTGFCLENGKRKNNEKNENEPKPKKRCVEGKQGTTPNELIFIRERQKEYVRQQTAHQFIPFQGKGYSLKDD